MKKAILTVLTVFVYVLLFGQTNEEINQIEFIKELQIWNKTDNKMSLAFWIPNSYWRIALKDNPQVPNETINLIENAFEDYVLLCAADILINMNGTLTFKEDLELRNKIIIIDGNGNKHSPLLDSKIKDDTKLLVESIKPMFTQMFGQFGEALHFYLFEVKDANNKALINERESGEFTVKHSDVEFKWQLPLEAMMPAKYCPIDNEKMKGHWNYCPIHGVKLDQ